MELTVVQALLIALFVAAVQSRGLGYATLTMRFSPMMTGLVVGIVMGRVPEAMVITAGIQLVITAPLLSHSFRSSCASCFGEVVPLNSDKSARSR